MLRPFILSLLALTCCYSASSAAQDHTTICMQQQSFRGVSAPPPDLRLGRYWDPGKPGHGWDFFKQLGAPAAAAEQGWLVWYTYDADGTPRYYEARAPIDQPQNFVWENVELNIYTLENDIRVGTEVGVIDAAFEEQPNGLYKIGVAWALDSHPFTDNSHARVCSAWRILRFSPTAATDHPRPMRIAVIGA